MSGQEERKQSDDGTAPAHEPSTRDTPRRTPGRPRKTSNDATPAKSPSRSRTRQPAEVAEDSPPAPANDIDTTPEIMDLKEVAQFLRFSLNHTRELAEDGSIPGWKLGSQWRFSRRALFAEMGWDDSG